MADSNKKIVYLDLLAKFKELMDGQISAADSAVDAGIKAIIGTLPEGKTVAQAIAEAQTNATYDDEEVKGLISDLADLVGELPEGATVDTVVAYITQQATIAKNAADAAQSDADALETLVGTLPADAVAKDVVGYAKEVADGKDAAIKAAKDAADAAQSDVDDLEELVGAIPSTSEAETVVGYVDEQVAKATGDASQVATDLATYKTSNDLAVQAAQAAADDAQDTIDTYKTTNDAAVKAAHDAADAAQADADALETLIGTGYGKVGDTDVDQTVKGYIDAKVGEINGSATTLEGRVKANEDAIDVLNGGEDEAGSVANTAKVAAQAAATALVDGAPEALDTLKEIADWISEQQASGEDGATQLVSKIENNKKAIEAEVTRATGVENGLDERIETLENKFTGEGSVESLIATAKSEAIAAAKTETETQVGNLQGETTSTVKDVEDAVKTLSDNVVYATEADVLRLFTTETEENA